ncbi:MAG: hypothetical protein LC799_01570, partial [Actinobacteria bacterium]|nr:hypothetical protein [Actinomycetota bacterium]
MPWTDPQADPLAGREEERRLTGTDGRTRVPKPFLLRDPGRRSSCGTPVVVPPAGPRSSFLLRDPVVVPPAGPG